MKQQNASNSNENAIQEPQQENGRAKTQFIGKSRTENEKRRVIIYTQFEEDHQFFMEY